METPTDCPKGMTVAKMPDAATTAGDLSCMRSMHVSRAQHRAQLQVMTF